MPENFSTAKLLRYALITSPFFGLFGSIPGFAMREFEMQRTVNVFLFVTCITFFFWLINILLVWISSKYSWLQNNIPRVLISTIICSIAVFLVFRLIHPLPPPVNIHKMQLPAQQTQPRRFLIPITQFIAINIILFILIELIILRKTKDSVALENEQLKLANLEARNNQLRQQLHPHFLFNSLSTLRSLIHRSPEEAEDYLEKLAELLRFSTNNSRQTLISLKEEVELCTNYLNMQRVRFGNALFFLINIDETVQAKGKVPVYSLQLLAENAIKHNILTQKEPLGIELKLNADQQFITVKNNLQPKKTIEEKNGVGLANLSERYRMLNEDDIRIEKSDQNFSVTIKILQHAGNYN